MLSAAGLSLDQAPPIELPFGFFLLATPFLILAGGLLAWQGELILLSRWSPPALALTHLLTLGFLTQVMSGALLQMLPVLAGVPVPRVGLAARSAQALLVTGCLALCWGLYSGAQVWLMVGGTELGLAVAVLVTALGIALVRARGVPQTLLAMRLALLGLIMTLLLGVLLLAVLLGMGPTGFAAWVDLHMGWGLLGWAGMLILGVGFQVVPMFHVTPSYPRWVTRLLAPVLFAGLAAATLAAGLGRPGWLPYALAPAIAALVGFSIVTLRLQQRRERPRLDTTLLYWRVSMSLMILAAILWLLGGRAELIGVMTLLGIGVGLPSGMLLKIMPFLSWFHLQHRQVARRRFDVRLPHMQLFLPERWARAQFWVFVAALAALMAAAAAPGLAWSWVLARAGGVLVLASAALLWWLQWSCYRTYLEVRRRLD
jgi:hypothetical protein